MQEIRSSNLPVVTGICDPNKCRAQQHRKNISFSSLTLFYPLKVTKFLVQIPQFEFLVMTEKSIFVYKLFSIIKYSIF